MWLDPSFGPHDPRLARRDPMARRLQRVGGVLLVRRLLRGLGAVDQMTLALTRLDEVLDRFRMGLFAGAGGGWELDAVLLGPSDWMRAKEEG
jgi:hypothetical protein